MCPSPDVLRPMQPAVGDMTGAHVSDERRVVPSVYRALCTSTLDNIQHVLEKFTQPTLGAGPGENAAHLARRARFALMRRREAGGAAVARVN